MLHRLAIRVYAWVLVAAVCAVCAAPASAQFKPRFTTTPASGEDYHIEASAALWWPTADISIASGGSGILTGIVGTTIDAKNDLGLTDRRLPEIAVVLRPTKSQKLRFQYIPISYEQTSTLTRDVIFNGQRYSIGLPTTSTVDWKAYRFGYEYDFITNSKGFGGFIVEAKYTDLQVTLNAPLISEYVKARAPIPALGGIARYYIVPYLAITGEVTAFKLPTIQNKYSGHYVDVDINGTLNFTNNVGTQIGFRAMDLGYLAKTDNGSMTLKGLYVGVVARY